ncbi:ParB N-terminal domain-containing protein [Sphingomonas bacterium]|uniref:ParB N-terminal domain-containing protein n=1 Tax=Sphingomonas bacterium TaxID=1895847 RepID=UPI00260FADD9|nr:ParB N-terminal domain-containing protein [Sphingomonas bacterium]MDB5677974.1 chromosome partitioning protein ParB [Sphingomonas bacterium]
MTARRSKPSFASLLRSSSRRDEDSAPVDLPLPGTDGSFHVDPTRVRLWSGLVGPTPEECRDRINAIVRDGQAEPVTVRPVFDDAHYEYEIIAGARDYVAVRHLRETAIPALELLVRVALVDDDGVGELVAGAALPGPLAAAADLAARLDGPLGPVILVTAAQIARAQAARRGDGLPPYPPAEVMRLIDAIGADDAAEPLSLSIVEASASTVTFRVGAEEDMPPEMLARIVKSMIDGAAADGIAVKWATAPSAATDP